MDCNHFIPYTPRSIKYIAEPATILCERTVAILQPIIVKALEAFPEAGHSVSLALLEFSREYGIP